MCVAREEREVRVHKIRRCGQGVGEGRREFPRACFVHGCAATSLSVFRTAGLFRLKRNQSQLHINEAFNYVVMVDVFRVWHSRT